MKSVRLNELLRRQILTSVSDEYVINQLKGTGCSTLDEFKASTDKDATVIANTLWDRWYGAWHFKSVPEWALVKERTLLVFLEDDSAQVFRAKTSGLRPTKPNVADGIACQADWALWFGDFFKNKEEISRIGQGCVDLRAEVRPILDSVGSTKQLLEIWPSMENFLPPHIADPDTGINLPALSISRLQQKIMGEQ